MGYTAGQLCVPAEKPGQINQGKQGGKHDPKEQEKPVGRVKSEPAQAKPVGQVADRQRDICFQQVYEKCWHDLVD